MVEKRKRGNRFTISSDQLPKQLEIKLRKGTSYKRAFDDAEIERVGRIRIGLASDYTGQESGLTTTLYPGPSTLLAALEKCNYDLSFLGSLLNEARAGFNPNGEKDPGNIFLGVVNRRLKGPDTV